jgi:hypothetical protein
MPPPTSALMELVATIAPPVPCSFICRATAWVT